MLDRYDHPIVPWPPNLFPEIIHASSLYCLITVGGRMGSATREGTRLYRHPVLEPNSATAADTDCGTG